MDTANKKYQGQAVTHVREARHGDDGFQHDVNKYVVTLADGSRRTIRDDEFDTDEKPTGT